MQNSVLKIFALTCAIIVAVGAEHVDGNHADTANHYWRDFKGEIPEDALPGGENVHGHKTYLGQAVHEDQVLPAKIDPQEKRVYFESGLKQFTAYKNVKILCTQNPEKFEWVRSTHIPGLQLNQLVSAGDQDGVALFFGRKQLPDELVVGKVDPSKDPSILNITKNGVCIQHTDFDILVYNPHIKVEKKNKYGETPRVVVNEIQCEHSDPTSHQEYQGSVVINVYNGK